MGLIQQKENYHFVNELKRKHPIKKHQLDAVIPSRSSSGCEESFKFGKENIHIV